MFIFRSEGKIHLYRREKKYKHLIKTNEIR